MTDPLLIQSCAVAHGLQADLVVALIEQESGGNPWAWNPEPRYRYLWDVRKRAPFRTITPAERDAEYPPADFPVIAGDRDQEWWAQQASWGLTQVMGAVAREHGFRDSYLTKLCDPATNLQIGCQHLASAMKWARGNVSQALASYNAGRGGWRSTAGQAYARKVLARYERIRKDAER
jgi:hypothetical protein